MSVMEIDFGTCCRCKKREATKSLQHPDCGVDFGRLGSMNLCDPCYTIEMYEIDDWHDYID